LERENARVVERADRFLKGDEMKRKLLLICMCCLIAAPAVWGQAAKTPAKQPGVLGFLDPHTGAFRPVPPAAEDESGVFSATTFTGTVTLTITVTLKTTTLTNITCTQSISVLDGTTSPVFYIESDTVAATGSGTTRTCSLSIPYAWSLTTQSSDNMTTSYTVIGTTGTTSVVPERFASRSPLDTRKVPSTGTTTALTAAVTL
jgi:hypothetical protein